MNKSVEVNQYWISAIKNEKGSSFSNVTAFVIFILFE